MSYNVYDVSELVFAVQRASDVNGTAEVLINNYLLNAPAEKTQFWLETINISAEVERVCRRFMQSMPHTEQQITEPLMINGALVLRLTQLLTRLSDRNAHLQHMAFWIRRKLVHKDIHRPDWAQTPTCPVSVIYQDFPDLLKNQQTESQPLTVVCELIIDRCNLSKDQLVGEALNKWQNIVRNPTKNTSMSASCNKAVEAINTRKELSKSASRNKAVEAINTRKELSKSASRNKAVEAINTRKELSKSASRNKAVEAINTRKEVSKSAACKNAVEAINIRKKSSMSASCNRAVEANYHQPASSQTSRPTTNLLAKGIRKDAVPSQPRKVKPTTSKAQNEDLGFLFTDPIRLKTETPAVPKGSQPSVYIQPQATRKIQPNVIIDPLKVIDRKVTNLPEGHSFMKRELEVKRQRMMAKLQTKSAKSKSGSSNKRPATVKATASSHLSGHGTSGRRGNKRRAETTSVSLSAKRLRTTLTVRPSATSLMPKLARTCASSSVPSGADDSGVQGRCN